MGAGPNGLTAAVTLARGGLSVLCVEAGPDARRLREDRGAHAPRLSPRRLLGCAPRSGSPRRSSPGLGLERHGLRWIQPELAMVHPAARRARRRAVAGPRLHRPLARRAQHGDGQRWQALVAPYLRHFEAVQGDDARRLSARRRSGPGCSPSFKLAGHAGVRSPAADVVRGPRRRGAARRRRSLAVRLLAARRRAAQRRRAARSPASRLDVLGSTGSAGRARRAAPGEISAALASCLHELGGETRTSAPATSGSSPTGATWTGVQLAGGERIAGRTVIATTTPHVLVKPRRRLARRRLHPARAALPLRAARR